MTDVFEHSLRTQEIMSGAENYNGWIYGTLRPYLGRRIVDIGCSIGNITRYFLDRERVVGVDLSPAAVERLRARFADCPRFAATSGDISDPALAERLTPEKPDTVVCLNVLEHIQDDVGALANMRRMLVPGGRVLLLVPALRALYGTLDSADGHFRRYQKDTLSRALKAAGLVPLKTFYFNFLGMFGWFLNGRVLRREYLPEGQLGMFDKIAPLLRRVEEGIRPIVGQSLFAAAGRSA